MSEVCDIKVANLAMESNLGFWIFIEVHTVIPEQLFRANLLGIFESCVSEFAFHGSEIILNVVVLRVIPHVKIVI